MSKKCYRFFGGLLTAQEHWLNKMSEKGYRLIRAEKMLYEFEACKPDQVKYCVEFIAQKSKANASDYHEFLEGMGCNGVQREHNKKLNNGLPILHKVPPKRDYGRYFCIMAEKGGTSHGGLTEKLSPFFHAKKQEVNAYGR